MDLVDYCRKNNAIPVLHELLNDADKHYKQYHSFLGMIDTLNETIIGEEDGYIVKFTLLINDAGQKYINVYASVHFEDEYGDVVATDDNDVDVSLSLDKIQSLKLFIDTLYNKKKRDGMKRF